MLFIKIIIPPFLIGSNPPANSSNSDLQPWWIINILLNM